MSARAAGGRLAPRLSAPEAGAGSLAAPLAVLDRAVGWFVAPPAAAPRLAVAPARLDHAARVLVLGTPAAAPPTAAALAGALRARCGAAAAVVAVWSPGTGSAAGAAPPYVALPSARRMAARLAPRDLDASARGRLAWIALPPDEGRAVAAAGRVGAAVDVPLAVALAGPRTPQLDALLPDQDLIVVVTEDPDGPLGRMALAGLAGLAAATVTAGPLLGATRLAALAGLGGMRALAEPLRAAVRTLG